MSKKRRTVSIDEEVDEYLDSDEVNASALVNQLVKNHATAGGGEQAMLELRKEQLQSEMQSKENELQQKREEYRGVLDRLSEYEDETEEIIAEAADVLEGIPLDEGAYENPGVKNWAGKAGLSVEKFVEHLREYRQ